MKEITIDMLGDEIRVSSLEELKQIMRCNPDKRYYMTYCELKLKADAIYIFDNGMWKQITRDTCISLNSIYELKQDEHKEYKKIRVWKLCALLEKNPEKKFINEHNNIFSRCSEGQLLMDNGFCEYPSYVIVAVKEYVSKRKIIFDTDFGSACKQVFKDKIVVRLPNKEIGEHFKCPMGLTQMIYFATTETNSGIERKFIKFKPLGSELEHEFSFENAVDDSDVNAMYAVFDSMEELEGYEP